MKEIVKQYIDSKEAKATEENEQEYLEIKEIKNDVAMLEDYTEFITNKLK